MPPRPLRFEENFSRLPAAFARGFDAESSTVVEAVRASPGRSFTVVGSGASYSAAVYIARILETYFRVPAHARAPYDYYTAAAVPQGVILVSASGRNSDILAALHRAIASRAAPLVLVTTNANAPLLERIGDYPNAFSILIPSPPHEREGFFGVQSLLSIMAAFARTVPGASSMLQPSPSEWLASICRASAAFIDKEADRVTSVAAAAHVVGLATGWALPCLSDFESKFVEGGLGWLEASEAKNFTHGRFVNTLRRSGQSSLVLFLLRENSDVARAYLEHYGSLVPILPVVADTSGPFGCCELTVRMFYLFSKIAQLRQIEISRPHVPDAARKMFRGVGLYRALNFETRIDPLVDAVVAIKRTVATAAGIGGDEVPSAVPFAVVRASLADVFSTEFHALVCDYDGTLIPLQARNAGLSPELAAAFQQVLASGVPIAVITGRGRSAVADLRSAIPARYANQIYCYLYNGGALWRLDEAMPRLVVECEGIAELESRLRTCGDLQLFVDSIECASLRCQVTAHLSDVAHAAAALGIVEALLADRADITIRTSGRSIDVFPARVSKTQACHDFKSRALAEHGGMDVLIIGDRAEKGGNDFDLLQEQFSYSVGNLHWSPTTCFPVFDDQFEPLVGPSGTTALLHRLQLAPRSFTVAPWSRRSGTTGT